MVTKDLARRGANYGITRVDDDKRRSHCWIVRIQRKRLYWQGYFSDRVYGGKTKALDAARAFRDELLVSHLPMTRGENASVRRANNRSGVSGVFRRVDFETTSVGQVERASWIAYWTKSDGKRVIRKFSIRKYGETKAFQHAKMARKRALNEMQEPYVNSRALKNWLRRHPAT